MKIMALSTNDTIKWQDVKELYNSLNAVRTKFSISTVAIPEEAGSKPIPSHITTIKDLVSAMSSNGYIGAAASTSSVPTPIVGELTKPVSLTQLDTIIDNINEICPYNPHTNDYSGFSFLGVDYFFGTTYFFSNNFSGFSDNGASFLFGSDFSGFSYNSWCNSQCSGGSFSFTGSF